ncbi:MAG: hypothetical protein PHN59_01050 [Candidatus Omnitrophica bacterium]|nr:hypothetical protein [Candidatus Omnitrophota bacterium]
MQDKFEWLVKQVYRRWKSTLAKTGGLHPDEEDLAGFIEGKLAPVQKESLISHFLSCDACTQILAAQMKLKESQELEVPVELLAKVKNLAQKEEKPQLLEIFLKLKENIFELIHTSGDVLVGQELVPAVLLRSRKIDKFKDEVTVLKDFDNLRVEIKIENKPDKFFDLIVIAKNKQTSQTLKDIRVTLIRDSLELASYLAESGKVIFEHIQLGKYALELFDLEKKLAAIILDIRS